MSDQRPYQFGDITKGFLRWAGVLDPEPTPTTTTTTTTTTTPPPPPLAMNSGGETKTTTAAPPLPPIADTTRAMNIASDTIAALPLATDVTPPPQVLKDILIDVLTTSSVLAVALPAVRKQALRETLRASSSNERALEILLHNLRSSPFIPKNKKEVLALWVLDQQWAKLRQELQCNLPKCKNSSLFLDFREMVTSIFTRSKKMRSLSNERRHYLGAAIHSQTSIDGLKALALKALESAETFSATDGSRDRVALNILSDRYDLLLLPDQFDCEDIRRVGAIDSSSCSDGGCTRKETGGSGERKATTTSSLTTTSGSIEMEDDEDDECPVCLGCAEVDTVLGCGHGFCRKCIVDWGTRTNTCPMCRSEFDVTKLQ
jgi:hypothetical protein